MFHRFGGSALRIADLEQLKFVDKIAKVTSIVFYHGGDELYELEGVPGTWQRAVL